MHLLLHPNLFKIYFFLFPDAELGKMSCCKCTAAGSPNAGKGLSAQLSHNRGSGRGFETYENCTLQLNTRVAKQRAARLPGHEWTAA